MENASTGAGDVWAHYLRALIRIGVGGRTLAIQLLDDDDPRLQCSGPWPFDGSVVILTAWNPGSRPRAHKANTAAQEALEAELRAAGYALLPAEGIGPDTGWSEPSVAVPGMDVAAAVETGVRHGQRALYRLHASAAEVIGCLDGDRRERRAWRSHWENG